MGRLQSSRLRMAGLIAIVAAVECNPPPAPMGGGSHHDTRECLAGGNAEWFSDGFRDTLFSPPCPYPVPAANTQLAFAVTLSVSDANVNATANVFTDIFNSTGHPVGGEGVSPSPSIRTTTACTHSQRGRSWVAPGVPIQDSADFQVLGTNSGQLAEGWVHLPGDISSGAAIIIGAPNQPVGTRSWRAQPDWDTAMYTYKWLIDRAASDQRHARYARTCAFPLAGIHTIKAIDIQESGKADTTTFNASIGPSVILTGPTTVTSTAPNTYTATPSGCNTTCTFNWTVTTAQGVTHFGTSTGTTSLQFSSAEGSPITVAVQPLSNSVTGNGAVLSVVNSQGSCAGKLIC